MKLEIQHQNLLEISAIYLQKVEVLLGKQVAIELSNINLDMRTTTYFNDKISQEGKFTYTKSQTLNKLLDFYSVLEMGFLTGFIPSNYVYDYSKIVSSPKGGNIENYCFIHYKSSLPLDLFERLEGQSDHERVVADNKTIAIIYEFLSVVDYIEDHPSILRLLSYNDNSLITLFNTLRKIEHIFFENLPKGKRQMVTGYFAYLELLPMIAELIQEANSNEPLKRAFTIYFTKMIDEDEKTIKYILDETNNLYEHFYNDKTSEENVARFLDFNGCLNVLRKALSESSSFMLV